MCGGVRSDEKNVAWISPCHISSLIVRGKVKERLNSMIRMRAVEHEGLENYERKGLQQIIKHLSNSSYIEVIINKIIAANI